MLSFFRIWPWHTFAEKRQVMAIENEIVRFIAEMELGPAGPGEVRGRTPSGRKPVWIPPQGNLWHRQRDGEDEGGRQGKFCRVREAVKATEELQLCPEDHHQGDGFLYCCPQHQPDVHQTAEPAGQDSAFCPVLHAQGSQSPVVNCFQTL